MPGYFPILLPQKIKTKRSLLVILISSIPNIIKWFAGGIFEEWVFSNMLEQIQNVPIVVWFLFPILGICIAFLWSFWDAISERRNMMVYIPKLMLELYKRTFKLKDKVVQEAKNYRVYVDQDSADLLAVAISSENHPEWKEWAGDIKRSVGIKGNRVKNKKQINGITDEVINGLNIREDLSDVEGIHLISLVYDSRGLGLKHHKENDVRWNKLYEELRIRRIQEGDVELGKMIDQFVSRIYDLANLCIPIDIINMLPEEMKPSLLLINDMSNPYMRIDNEVNQAVDNVTQRLKQIHGQDKVLSSSVAV